MQVRLETTYGNIILTLNRDLAPITVENFVRYVEEKHYDDTIFHRVIKDFVIQGGGLDVNMVDKPTHPAIQNEANNGLQNLLHTVAMARTKDPHSAQSQFFINMDDNAFLNFDAETNDGWGYCVFGEVTDGMQIAEKINKLATTTKNGYQDVPEELVLLKHATLLR